MSAQLAVVEVDGSPKVAFSRLHRGETNLPGEIDWVQRAAVLLSHEIDFIMHESFRKLRDSDAELQLPAIVGMKNHPPQAARSRKLSEATVHYQRMCETPLLTADLEVACFRRFNWLKFRANAFRCQLDLNHVDAEQVLFIEQLLGEAAEIRNHIVEANCRLAMSIVKKFADSSIVFDELFSEVISTLIGAVEKFDFSRGYRFSTYATQSIHRRLYRILTQRHKQRTRFVNNSEESVSASLSAQEGLSTHQTLEQLTQLYSLIGQLDRRERLIIEARFGLHSLGKKQTFVEIGERLKISKERVRQLAERALIKLKSLAEEIQFDRA